MPDDVTRHISQSIQRMLWGKAAGRCEFAGCNKELWKSSVTQEEVNIAQQAHIWSFSGEGPRGHDGVSETVLNTLANLMLVCHQCHRKMDKQQDGGRYSVDLLRAMKEQHERRIGIVTGIAPEKRSHILLYGANIGDHESPLQYALAAEALFPDRYPAEERPIVVGTVGSLRDGDADFWSVERLSLARKCDQQVRSRITGGEISHLSVFARAPQPLLILLGTFLTDISEVDVFQLCREPKGWRWANDETHLELQIVEPANPHGVPALVLSLSATITDDRIVDVLGEPASIWRVTIPKPHNDFLRSRSQLVTFRRAMRDLMDRIKATHGEEATLHVFPAMPIAAAVELGRIRMPKADLDWQVYDQVKQLGGFVPAISIEKGFQTCPSATVS